MTRTRIPTPPGVTTHGACSIAAPANATARLNEAAVADLRVFLRGLLTATETVAFGIHDPHGLRAVAAFRRWLEVTDPPDLLLGGDAICDWTEAYIAAVTQRCVCGTA